MSKKRTRYTVPTLTLEYLIQGNSVFGEALGAGTTTWATLHKVVDKLSKYNKTKAAEAAAWIEENEPESTGAKGRTPPAPGDTRTYSVQKLNKGGGRFIRLPVDLLSNDKKDTVIVEYHENKIVIRPGEAREEGNSEEEIEEEVEETPTRASDLLTGFDKPKRTMRRKKSA